MSVCIFKKCVVKLSSVAGSGFPLPDQVEDMFRGNDKKQIDERKERKEK